MPLTLRRRKWRRSGSNRHLPRCKRGALPVELHPQVNECGRADSTHHSARPQGYSLLSSPMLGVRTRGGRPDSNRYREVHDLGCCRYTTTTTHVNEAGTTGLEPAAVRLTSERSPSELRPRRWRGWDSNPRSRAHEAREDSRSSTALHCKVWPAGVEPAISGARSRRGGHAPLRPDEYPRRDSNPQLPG